MSLFLKVIFSFWLLWSSISYAQTELNNPTCVLELSELSPDTSESLVSYNLPDHLKIPLIDLTRLRIKLTRGLDQQTSLSGHYSNELQKLKEAFFDQGYTETFFDETRVFFFRKLSQKNETLEREIETEKSLIKKQKDVISNYPLKGRTRQVIEAIVLELKIPEEDVTIQDLERIKKLDLSGKNITELREGDFKGLINLKALYLFCNELKMLPQNVFRGLSSLKRLALSHNQLTELPETVFQGLGRLERLELSRNQLTGLPENVFQGLGALVGLALSNNQLTELPENIFRGLGALEWLTLSINQLRALPETVFQGLGALIELSINKNPIVTISESVFSVSGLNQNLVIELHNLPLDKNTKQKLREKYGSRIEGLN